MNSRRLWNSYQRHKFLRAKASRDILKYRVSEIAFPGVFEKYFPPRTPSCFVGISRRSRAVAAKKWTKKRDARAKLLFYSKPVFFFCRSRRCRRRRSLLHNRLRDDTKNGCVADYRRRCPSYLFHRCPASVAMFSFYFSLSPLSYLGDLMSGIPEVH